MNGALDFHANGKLLITGEYLVLVGAVALALPLRFGQKLHVTETESRIIDWESSTTTGQWFAGKFDADTFQVISVGNVKIADKLVRVLSAARKLNPDFLTGENGFRVTTRANYPIEWGLGSSSSLCHLIAGWAGVNALDLHALISNGSGYDVACAGQSDMRFFQLNHGKNEITPASAGKALYENAYFVYLGNKQDTEREVIAFLENTNHTKNEVKRVSLLSSLICQAGSYVELCCLVEEHESILSKILKRESIARRFPSFPGTVKSLGAWGGDFAMFVSGNEPAEVINIIHRQGFSEVFTFSDIKALS